MTQYPYGEDFDSFFYPPLPSKSGDYLVKANSITAFGAPILHPEIAGSRNLQELVKELNEKVSCLGIWSPTLDGEICLRGKYGALVIDWEP